MSLIRGTEIVDDFTLGLISSAKGIKAAVNNNDKIGAVHASIEHARGYVEGAYDATLGVEKGTATVALASKHLSFTVDEKIIHSLQGITATQVIAGIGIVLSALVIIVNSISIHRQNEVLSVIPDKEELKNDVVLANTLDSLGKFNYNHFRNTLPLHLKAKIDFYGGKDAFGYFKAEIEKGRSTAARELVGEIQKYINRKQVSHILTLMGSIVSLVASIGLLMGFPPLALTILAIVGLALTITYILVSNGWVENTKNGFNWKLCLPEFMQKKLRVDEKPKPGVDLMNIHEGITPQIHMLKIGSVVEEKEATPFRAPPELEKEPERKLAFWEKLKAKFKKEKKVIIEETKRPVSHPVKDSETLSLSDAMAMQGILRIGSHRAHKLPNTPEGGSR